MSNVVTSTTAAASQLGLFAPRQQVFVVERVGSAPDDAAILNSGPRSALHTPTQSALETRREEALANQTHDGPSRARVEIRSLDMGLTPAEVVGTPDVLQRFDENGDGRVDLTEADKATLSRQKGTTFAGVGNGVAEPKKVIITAGDGTVQTVVVDAGSKVSTATVEVPKRLYGQGAEVSVGPAVAQTAADPNAKVHVADPKLPIVEDGTGEVKLHDKVAQTEQTQGDASANAQPSLFEKARAIAAAANGGKKTVLVAAYTSTAKAPAKAVIA
jgi:hypothetical protein